MKKLSLTFATAIIFALGTFTLRSMLTGSPASNPGVSSPAPRVSAATNSARSALPSQTPAAGKMGLIENYGRLPLSFEANQGQTDPQVKFLSRGHGYSLFLTGDEAVLALRSQKSEVRSQQGSADLLSKVRGFSRPDAQEPQRVATVGVLPTVGSSIVGGKPTVRRALTVATSLQGHAGKPQESNFRHLPSCPRSPTHCPAPVEAKSSADAEDVNRAS